jgi:hypothetical protein
MIARAVLVSMLLAVATVASAQESDVQAAAAAFGEAQRAQLRGDFAQAADLFEIADRAAPSPAALRSTIRNHRAAGQSARAATLSAEASTRYPDDAETSALATETLTALAPSLGHVSLRCASECTVTLDGRALESIPPTVADAGQRLLRGMYGREQGPLVELEAEALRPERLAAMEHAGN